MKVHSLLLAFLLGLASVTAVAQEGDGLYYGIKGGFMDSDQGQLDTAFNLGALLGYNIPGVRQLPGLVGIEGEFTLSAIKGDVSGGGDWDVQTLAGYGVYRSGGPLYFKGKAGIAHQRINIEGVPGDQKDTSFSFGIGGGLKMGEGRVEVEYNWLEDLNFISVGYIF